MKLSIPYSEENQLNGIFTFFNHILKKQLFSIYTITNSYFYSDPIKTTFRDQNNTYFWVSEPNYPNITFSFDNPIYLTDYTIKNALNHSFPEDFAVFGSNNNDTWTQIDTANDNQFCLTETGNCGSSQTIIHFIVDNPGLYKYIRLMNIKNSEHDDNFYMIFSSIEFFGVISYEISITSEYLSFNLRHSLLHLFSIMLI